ncbi:hypothetical protein EYF80_054416 [Liparis tanakae]|uniref:Uncharacterized protein n=1 Tax=Liparis tanakae TaxID=230148 RepID=A0A4Z2F3F6_9TELE|nr:hypothetical protein EYF80_054416 [Liparis tanakae]
MQKTLVDSTDGTKVTEPSASSGGKKRSEETKRRHFPPRSGSDSGVPPEALEEHPTAEKRAGLGRRLLLHFALIGQLGGALGAEVRGHVAGQPPLGGKGGVAASDHTLQESQGSQGSQGQLKVRGKRPGGVLCGGVTLKGLSPLWVSMCLCSQLWLVDGVLYTLQPFHRHTNTCVTNRQAHTPMTNRHPGRAAGRDDWRRTAGLVRYRQPTLCSSDVTDSLIRTPPL